jgi:hypothetical protein
MKKQTQFQKEDSKQVAWESWFILSIVFFGGIFFICTLEGSRQLVELPYLLAISIINLVYCIYIGKKPR